MSSKPAHSGGQPTPPPAIKDRAVLRKKIWNRMNKKDKNWMGIVCGDTGSGKSEWALRLCELLDPNFSVDQIAFTIEDFLRLVNDRSFDRGSMILFDEVGVALDASTHYDQDQIQLNHILETWREQNRGLVMTAPHIGLVQKKSRGLLHAQMDMQQINYDHFLSRARYRNISQDTDSGDLYKKYPRLRDPATGRKTKYRFVDLYKPSPGIVEAYQSRKLEFNKALNQDVLDAVALEEEEAQALSPSEVADTILDEDIVGRFVETHPMNGMNFVSKELLQAEYGLSVRKSKTAKKLLEQEVNADDYAE